MDNIDELYKTIGNRIINMRKQRGFSQEDLSNLSGVDRSHIGFIEQGRRRPTIGTIFKLTKAMDFRIEEVFEELR